MLHIYFFFWTQVFNWSYWVRWIVLPFLTTQLSLEKRACREIVRPKHRLRLLSPTSAACIYFIWNRRLTEPIQLRNRDKFLLCPVMHYPWLEPSMGQKAVWWQWCRKTFQFDSIIADGKRKFPYYLSEKSDRSSLNLVFPYQWSIGEFSGTEISLCIQFPYLTFLAM